MTDTPLDRASRLRPLRVAVAEDHAPLRAALLRRLRFFADVEVVASAADGVELLDLLADLGEARMAEAVLMDIEMPRMDGVAATEAVLARWPGTAVVMLTVFEDEARIADALAAGAAGYLLKDEPADVVVAALLSAAAGGSPVSDGVAAALVRRVRDDEGARRVARRRLAALALTPREYEVLQLLAAGTTDDAIAERLFLSPHTVQSYTKSLYRKLDVHSRAAAVQRASQLGVS